jgi:predicted RNase H-like HicB family nuclease
MAKTYRVVYERDEDGWWVAKIPALRGCHSQGRSIHQARERIREALGLFVDNANHARFEDDVRLPSSACRALAGYRLARKRSEEELTRSRETAAHVVSLLTRSLGLSVRDAAEILGLSHQRVQQIANA